MHIIYNLYVERGRYKTPIVPRESRWCVFCHSKTGKHIIEDELHVLLHCPLYQNLKSGESFRGLYDTSNISDLFTDPVKDSTKLVHVGALLHNILEINQHYTSYYGSQDFHNAGNCVIL